jgi:hypothetical protein
MNIFEENEKKENTFGFIYTANFFSTRFTGIPCELLGTLSIAWNFHGISLFPIEIIRFPQ